MGAPSLDIGAQLTQVQLATSGLSGVQPAITVLCDKSRVFVEASPAFSQINLLPSLGSWEGSYYWCSVMAG